MCQPMSTSSLNNTQNIKQLPFHTFSFTFISFICFYYVNFRMFRCLSLIALQQQRWISNISTSLPTDQGTTSSASTNTSTLPINFRPPVQLHPPNYHTSFRPESLPSMHDPYAWKGYYVHGPSRLDNSETPSCFTNKLCMVLSLSFPHLHIWLTARTLCISLLFL